MTDDAINTTIDNITTGNTTTNDTTTGDTTIVAVKRKRNRFHTENNTWFKTKDICQLYGVYEILLSRQLLLSAITNTAVPLSTFNGFF